MKKWQWALLAIFVYLVFFIAYTPASFVADKIQQASDNQIQLSGVSGTLFNGKAQALSSKGIRVNNVQWQLSAMPLLYLSLDINIRGGNIRDADNIYAKGRVSSSLLNLQAFQAQNLSVFVPTKTLLAQFSLPVFVTASGRFRLDINELSFDNGCQTLQGKGNWLNGAVMLNNKQVDFGTFEANLSCESPALVVSIQPENTLNLNANLKVDMTGKYELNGRFKVPSSFPREIQNAANFFGAPQSDGFYQIAL